MADAKKVARGKGAIEKALAKLPEEKKGPLAALLESEDALEFLGEDGLRQDEFSRLTNELTAKREGVNAWKGQLDDWWKEKVDEINALKVKLALLEKGGGGSGNPDPADAALRTAGTELSGYVKREDVDKAINDRVAAAAGDVVPLVTVMTRYSMQHFKDFGEILDIDGLVKHSRATQTPIDRGAYESFVKEKIDAKNEQKHKDEMAAAEKRGEERARAAFGAATPYPVTNSEPSTLDGLNKEKAVAGAYGVDAAVAAYNKALAQPAG